MAASRDTDFWRTTEAGAFRRIMYLWKPAGNRAVRAPDMRLGKWVQNA